MGTPISYPEFQKPPNVNRDFMAEVLTRTSRARSTSTRSAATPMENPWFLVGNEGMRDPKTPFKGLYRVPYSIMLPY